MLYFLYNMTRKNEREIVLLALKFPKKCSCRYKISFKISLSNILPNLTDIQCITLIYIYVILFLISIVVLMKMFPFTFLCRPSWFIQTYYIMPSLVEVGQKWHVKSKDKNKGLDAVSPPQTCSCELKNKWNMPSIIFHV